MFILVDYIYMSWNSWSNLLTVHTWAWLWRR